MEVQHCAQGVPACFQQAQRGNYKLQATVDLPCGGKGSWGIRLMDTRTRNANASKVNLWAELYLYSHSVCTPYVL